jgi:hypothetical protein
MDLQPCSSVLLPSLPNRIEPERVTCVMDEQYRGINQSVLDT